MAHVLSTIMSNQLKLLHYNYGLVKRYYQVPLVQDQFHLALNDNAGGFFGHRPKNSRAQKLKLKDFGTKTQGFFVRKLNKPASLKTKVASIEM